MHNSRVVPHITMWKEARDTGRHRSYRPSNNLRNNTIAFVSGGSMRLDELENIAAERQRQDVQDPITTTEGTTVNDEVHSADSDARSKNDIFFVDSHRVMRTPKAPIDRPTSICPSPSLSDSSEDEVVFMGRNHHLNRSQHYVHLQCQETSRILQIAAPATTQIETIEDEPQFIVNPKPTKARTTCVESKSANETHPGRRKRRLHKKGLEDEAEIIADYLANMDTDESDESTVSAVLSTHPYMPRNSPEVRPASLIPSGLQDITAKGQTPNEARWFSRKFLTMSGADERILTFENDSIPASVIETVEEDFGYLAAKSALWEDQSENTPVSHDDLEESSYEGLVSDWDTDYPIHLCLTTKGQKHNRPKTHNYPSATTFVDEPEQDVYPGFDIMDFDRPSLRKQPKGSRHIPNFEVSDSELELQLAKAWDHDRTKKNQRKQQREQFRTQGLLGRKERKTNLSMNDLKSEVKAFLVSSSKSLSLSPMNKEYRRLVHEFANAVSLKSQSKGKGSTRFPVLYKTSRTPEFTDKDIAKVEALLSQRRFSRQKGDFGIADRSKARNKGRGKPNTAVSYVDGDIVGASAPEIGADNKGRAMLEKMGWSTGTALGALNNKGILQPVAHIVKNSRTGLG